MNPRSPKVDAIEAKAKHWNSEIDALRSLLLDCQLDEDLKWFQPCFSYQKTNLIILGRLKEYCCLSFFKGVLLKDPKGILHQPGENTQSARIIKFTSTAQILEMEPTIRAYVAEAIEAEKAGLKVEFKQSTALVYPEEFQNKLDSMPALTTAFDALTPGRRRAYNLFFSSAKQAKTREARVEKCLPKILEGKGIDE